MFSEFLQKCYEAASNEVLETRFKSESKKGNRVGMVKVLLDLPEIRDVRIAENFCGKDDAWAAELYNKAREILNSSEVRVDEENKACDILFEALCAASAGSKLFLDALSHCAKLLYKLKAFIRCLKYCECMLALPASLYDKTSENANYFLKCKEECRDLKSNCLKQIKSSLSAKKKKKKNGGRNVGERSEFNMELLKSREIPTVDGKPHRFLGNCSDLVDLKYNEKKGRHLVANRNIKAGSVLIVDYPFSFSTDEKALARNCLNCHSSLKLDDSVKIPCRYCRRVFFCTEECRENAWLTYHQYECPILDLFYGDQSKQPRQPSHLLLAYRTTVLESLSLNKTSINSTHEQFSGQFLDEDFLRCHSDNINNEIDLDKELNNNDEKGYSELGVKETYDSHDYKTILQLETHSGDADPMANLINAISAIFLAKCFIFMLSKMDIICSKETIVPLSAGMLFHLQIINCNAYEIVENVREETSHIWEPRYIGGGIYPAISLVNHSCYPNVVRHNYPSGAVVVKAIRPIAKDSELLDCYGPHFLSEGRIGRREYLWKKYRFLCACEACTNNWQFPLPETMSYKCQTCPNTFDVSMFSTIKNCPKCQKPVNGKKLEQQLRKSVDKRVNAISKMYDGHYKEALPILFEHIQFIEKYFVAPNIETVKTQQCIIQCYNYFGSTSR